MPRFVVLHHVMPPLSDRPDHWDLMLEKESSAVLDPAEKTLETWALDAQPSIGRTIGARKLPDHRAYYLDNDGPLSDDRGVVTRQMCGEFEWILNGLDKKQIKLFTEDQIWTLIIRKVNSVDFEVEITESNAASSG